MDTRTITEPRITQLEVRAIDVPYTRPIQTASGTMASASFVLVDLHTDADAVGRAYVRCYTPLALVPVAEVVRGLRPSLVGQPLAPVELWIQLRARFRLLGTEGLVGLALNLIDMAAWDALARAARLPLARLLGGQPKRLPAYKSLRSLRGDELLEELDEALGEGFAAVKVKLGGPPAADRKILSALRARLGDDRDLMCDYNQSLTLDQALEAVTALEPLRLRWVEEPLPAGDLDGYRRLVARTRTAIQAGESWWSPEEAHRSLTQAASDLVMLDVARVGGVTGWLRAASAAEAAGRRVSSHTFPEFSSQLLSVAANADLLEWLDSANPFNETPVQLASGAVEPWRGPGVGLSWDEEAVAHHTVELGSRR